MDAFSLLYGGTLIKPSLRKSAPYTFEKVYGNHFGNYFW
ncbi:hypothetical protein B4158_5869 [Bacillus cereus]|nr:hypothetical protein B4158_5869 [Bacillus cereus]